ncbi:MAG: pyruvate:ferredoxin (flavodoxin) oxidoreductase [Saprospiraceae bacterium]|nr:pyruvate:ferredoxin (flavodoxin) oxidoreductase [Saprospiraceae bacterium]
MEVSVKESKKSRSKTNLQDTVIIDGNEAAAYIAYKCSEVCAIYPITPSSAMGEWVDEWSSENRKNIFDSIPKVVEMQSEAGAAGALHGCIQGGSLATTFTCSQGLLLMIPNMFKIAGELSPTVFHIAARAVATHALSIFGDHSDVMAVRSTGYAMLFGCNAQEAHDMAMISHAASLKASIPFLNIFDGFRSSHELSRVRLISDNIIEKLIDQDALKKFRKRALTPDNPKIRGTAQNPDVFFQSREASNPFYKKLPDIVSELMNTFQQLTGRAYSPFEYYGSPTARRVIVIMGSGVGPVREIVDYLNLQGTEVGCIAVRLYRPFSVKHFLETIPVTVESVSVLDRCKEPGSIGEPLYMDVVNAFMEGWKHPIPKITGGRYGLASKEFTAAMAKAVFEELEKPFPQNHFTIGITDDVTHKSLNWNNEFSLDQQHEFRGIFFGLGADGTVSANKNSIKIIGELTDFFVQAYFVYDSKKSGSLTVSHLRFGNRPILSTYLIDQANFIACHHARFLEKYDVLKPAVHEGIFLLNTPLSEIEIWKKLPLRIQEEIIKKKLKFYVVNASEIAKETGMGTKINTILQTCFFYLAGIIPIQDAIVQIKDSIRQTYAIKGEAILNKNFMAVDKAIQNLKLVNYDEFRSDQDSKEKLLSEKAPDFVKNVLSKIMVGEGDQLPVSAFPVDGTYPTSSSKWEKRDIAEAVPVWDEKLCSQCGKCFIICPHAAIRSKVYDKSLLESAPSSFKHTAPIGKEFNKETEAYTLQVSVEDCTGCKICVEYCPVESKSLIGYKAINMADPEPIKIDEKINWEYFLNLPDVDRERLNLQSVKGTQLLEPLFEFSGACAGCGETPYIKLLSQLFGDRMLVANATGCSSIFGANLPTTPWTVNADGLGPAWANSLFEDNAEFGYGLKLASDNLFEKAHSLLESLQEEVGIELYKELVKLSKDTQGESKQLRSLIQQLRVILTRINSNESKELNLLADYLVKKSIWIIGGDGWAYDIGFSGLDHVLSTGENLNILVLDTEVYSNTGGQKSKSTPLGACAKFAIKGKTTSKKNLALQAIAHNKAFVAQVAIGANDVHTIRTIREAEAFPGPSIIIAYSHCISHGYDMMFGAAQQENAVKSGYWPLFRFHPDKPKGERFILDSKDPSIPVFEFLENENRFRNLNFSDSGDGNEMIQTIQSNIVRNWEQLQLLKSL